MVIPLALVAMGASLASGLLSKSSAKKQAAKEERAIRDANDKASAAAEQMNKQIRARADAAALVPVQTEREHFGATSSAGGVNMDAFLAAAEKGGFNPLTFLRSGALSLFSETETQEYVDDWTCTTGERAMDAALSGTYLPQLSPVLAQTKVPGMGDVVGSALTSGANQYLSDMSQKDQNNFQMDLLRQKLAGVGSSGAYSGPRSGYVPQAFLRGSNTVQAGPGLSFEQALAQPGYDPGWVAMPNGSVVPVSALKNPVTTFDDVVASADQTRRKLEEVRNDPWWNSLLINRSDLEPWVSGSDITYLPARPAPPSFSWRDFSKGVDDYINRVLLP